TAKDPVTDQRKRSKEGRLKLVRTPDGGWDTLSSIDDADRFDAEHDELVTVFADGEVTRRWTLAEIRERGRGESPPPPPPSRCGRRGETHRAPLAHRNGRGGWG